MQHQPLVLTGPEPVPPIRQKHKESILTLLQHVHTYPTSIQSDLARTAAQEIAEAASRGYISTKVVPTADTFGRVWKITHTGLMYLTSNARLIADVELRAYNAHE